MKYTLKRAFSVLAGRLSSSVERGEPAGSFPVGGAGAEGETEDGDRAGFSERETNPAKASLNKRAECLRVLELKDNATQLDIKASYRRLCKKYHPDRFANEPDKLKVATELFAKINAAYEYLK